MALRQDTTASQGNNAGSPSQADKSSADNASKKAGDVPVTYQPESGQPGDRNLQGTPTRTTKDDI